MTHPWFDNFILFTNHANSVILALQDYSNVNPETFETMTKGSLEEHWLRTPTIFAGFTIECTLKIVAMGFITEEGAYLRNGLIGWIFGCLFRPADIF